MIDIKKIIVLLFLTLANLDAFKIDAFNKDATLTENFSTNCLQMTQSQQMLKAYVMVGLNSTFQNPKEHLKQAIIDYDKRVYQVREYFHKLLKEKNSKGKQSFDEALTLWQESKLLLEKTPTKQNALIIKDNFQKMITKLLDGTKPLATPELELISLTGKLCRKPIEITIDYLLKIWGLTIPKYAKTIEAIINNYHKNLKTLNANKLNNQQSLDLLKKAKKQFMFFEMMYNAKSIFIPSLLSKKSDDNFLIIRKIKKIYKKEASK